MTPPYFFTAVIVAASQSLSPSSIHLKQVSFAGGTNERASSQVLLIARLLADHRRRKQDVRL